MPHPHAAQSCTFMHTRNAMCSRRLGVRRAHTCVHKARACSHTERKLMVCSKKKVFAVATAARSFLAGDGTHRILSVISAVLAVLFLWAFQWLLKYFVLFLLVFLCLPKLGLSSGGFSESSILFYVLSPHMPSSVVLFRIFRLVICFERHYERPNFQNGGPPASPQTTTAPSTLKKMSSNWLVSTNKIPNWMVILPFCWNGDQTIEFWVNFFAKCPTRRTLNRFIDFWENTLLNEYFAD